MRKRHQISTVTVLAGTILSLSSCTAQREFQPAEQVDGAYEAFLHGRVSLDCRFWCSGRWGANRDQIKFHYDVEEWEKLARAVITIGYDSQLAWYLLGRAAEALDRPAAARTYYLKSIHHHQKCKSFVDVCGGVDVEDASERIAKLLPRSGTWGQSRNLLGQRENENSSSACSFVQDRG